MQIRLRKLFPDDSRFSKKDTIYLVASLSKYELSIVGYIVYYKDGRRFDFSFKKARPQKLAHCRIYFNTVIDVAYTYQSDTRIDLKDALAQAFLDEHCRIDKIEFAKRDRLRPTRISIRLDAAYFTAREFKASG
jgi:hypothetical protein